MKPSIVLLVLLVAGCGKAEDSDGLKITVTTGGSRVTTEKYRDRACWALLAGYFDYFWIDHGNEAQPDFEFVKADKCKAAGFRGYETVYQEYHPYYPVTNPQP